MNQTQSDGIKHPSLVWMSLGALGVVYGDIGTSPLYAFRESVLHVQPTPFHILGILSLIFWSLILIISVKYIVFILRADNKGEGGVLALLGLLKTNGQFSKSFPVFLMAALLGASFLFSDGMLTPAMSVISAMEGLTVISPNATHFVVLGTLAILLALFSFQRYGTGKIGALFGPILLMWFMVIGFLGARKIMEYPVVLSAINPMYAIHFFQELGLKGYLVLGGIFLVITGGEALYADIGHFGKNPIRVAWFAAVLPGILLNYFGQGAIMLENPANIQNPFYLLAPHSWIFPMVIFSTVSTIIASQAVISAVFSLAKQAMSLGYFPKMQVVHTSLCTKGQIYIPTMNILLMCGTLSLVVFFRTSNNLANAYGLAVNLVMLIVSLLLFVVARKCWQWSVLKSALLLILCVGTDLAFLGANLHKLGSGGYFPVIVGLFGASVMLAWRLRRLAAHRMITAEMADLASARASMKAKTAQAVSR